MWFSKGSDPRSARASAVETQLFIFGVASKKISFLQQLSGHFWYNWRRDPLKRHFKIEFENRNCKSVVVLLSDSILASFWIPYGESFRAFGALVPSKRQGFREPGALDSQKVVSHPVQGPHIAFFSSRAPRATQENDYLTCLPLALGGRPSKRRPIKFDIKLGSAT